MQFLYAVANGSVLLRTGTDSQAVLHTSLEYTASNGWRLIVDVDMSSFGGFHVIESDDGRTLSGCPLDAMDRALDDAFERNQWLEWEGFGLGGYIGYRCPVCGASIHDHEGWGAPENFCGSECEALLVPDTSATRL